MGISKILTAVLVLKYCESALVYRLILSRPTCVKLGLEMSDLAGAASLLNTSTGSEWWLLQRARSHDIQRCPKHLTVSNAISLRSRRLLFFR